MCRVGKQKKAGRNMNNMHSGVMDCSMEEENGCQMGEEADCEISRLMSRLYQENYSRLLSYVLKQGLHLSVAEDIVQDAYYEAIRKPEEIRVHPNPGGWLMNTVKNKILGWNSRMENRSCRELAEWESSIMDLEDEYGALELTLLVDSMMSPYERKMFRMYFLQGYSAREMAELEHITENNFKVRMCRLRSRLAKEVRKHI